MFANSLLLLGTTTFLLISLDVLLSTAQKRLLASWSVIFWNIIDDARRKALDIAINFMNYMFEEPEPTEEEVEEFVKQTGITDDVLLSYDDSDDAGTTRSGASIWLPLALVTFILVTSAVFSWASLYFIYTYGQSLLYRILDLHWLAQAPIYLVLALIAYPFALVGDLSIAVCAC